MLVLESFFSHGFDSRPFAGYGKSSLRIANTLFNPCNSLYSGENH